MFRKGGRKDGEKAWKNVMRVSKRALVEEKEENDKNKFVKDMPNYCFFSQLLGMHVLGLEKKRWSSARWGLMLGFNWFFGGF